MSTDALTGQTAEWRLVETDAGPVTLATAEALRARAVDWRNWTARVEASARSLREQSDEHLAQAGSTLVAHTNGWTIPTGLQPTVDQAKALTQQVGADEQGQAALKSQERSAGLFGRIGGWRREHELEQDRTRAAAQVRALLVEIARAAPMPSIPIADSERKTAADLESQARSAEAQIATALQRAKGWEDEAKQRQDAIKAMGFDSLYMAAVLQSSGLAPVAAPLVLKNSEHAYLAMPATLARMVTRTHFVGGSGGFSIPIGHTGVRYRVGRFSGQPVHQQSLTRLDTGTFVVTNQRVAYVGRTKSASIPLAKLIHVEVYNDGLSIAREGKENPDFYLMDKPKYAVFLLNWALAQSAGH